MQASTALALCASVLAAAFLALYVVLGKLLVSELRVDPFVFLAHRQILAALLLLPLVWCEAGPKLLPPRSQWLRLLTLGTLFFVLSAGYLIGLELTNVLCVAVLPSMARHPSTRPCC